jgi:hypothetical protein
MADRLRDVRFADSGLAEQQDILLPLDEGARREVDDLGLGICGLKMKSKSSRVLWCSKPARRTRCSTCLASRRSTSS